MTAQDRAAALRALHQPGTPLVLPNVWDAASARVVREAGFPAIATASAAIAPVLGYEDHEGVPVGEVLAAVARIVRAVDVPVTADLERGYGLPPAEFVERVAETGAVGFNLEDSDPPTGRLIEAERQAEFLAAVRAAARAAGVDFVINARIDVWIRGEGTPEERLAETIGRAHRYLAAGADCVYPIVLADPDAIRTVVAESGGPVNLLCRPGTPSVPEMAAMGVARVSFGPGLHRAAQAHVARMAEAIRDGRDPFA